MRTRARRRSCSTCASATPSARGHVPGAINIGLAASSRRGPARCSTATARSSSWPTMSEGAEAVMRLARVGLENVEGALLGGMNAWRSTGRDLETLPQMSVDELRGALHDLQILDVRRRSEYDAGHVPTAINVPLDAISEWMSDIDCSKPLAIICASGYRSSTAASLLQPNLIRRRSTSSAAPQRGWPPDMRPNVNPDKDKDKKKKPKLDEVWRDAQGSHPRAQRPAGARPAADVDQPAGRTGHAGLVEVRHR